MDLIELAVIFFLGAILGTIIAFSYITRARDNDHHYYERRLKRLDEICKQKRIENEQKIRKSNDESVTRYLIGENRAYTAIQTVIDRRNAYKQYSNSSLLRHKMKKR